MAKLHVVKKLRNEPDILEVNEADLSSAIAGDIKAETDKCVKLTGDQEISGKKTFKSNVIFGSRTGGAVSQFEFTSSGKLYVNSNEYGADLNLSSGAKPMRWDELYRMHEATDALHMPSAVPALNQDTGKVEIEFSIPDDSNHYLYILTGENFFGITPISQTGEARGCMSMPVGNQGGSMLARYSLTKSASGYKFVYDSDYSTAIANNGHTFGTWYLQRLG